MSEKRSNTFFKPKAYTPEEWGQKFIDYLEDRKDKVWNKKEPIKSGEKAGTTMDVPHQLPLTIESFCVYAGVSMQTFRNYEKKENYDEYFEVTTRMREVIEVDQLEGAIVGAYNPNIIARKLGLTDKTETKVQAEQPLFPDLKALTNEELDYEIEKHKLFKKRMDEEY